MLSQRFSHSEFVLRELLIDHDREWIGAEIGLDRGFFSEALLTHLPNLTLIGVDPWCKATPSSEVGHHEYANWDFKEIEAEYRRRTALFASRAVILKMPSIEAAKWIDDLTLDFVFIDAQHTFSACTADIDAWEPKLKPSGLMMGHDYGARWGGVKRAVDYRYGARARVDPISTVWWII